MFIVGPLVFHLYGLLIGLGVLAGTWAASKKDKLVWEAALWAVWLGIAGARAYHVIDFWGYYHSHLLQIPAVWQGGMGIYGGIVGGILGLGMYVKKRKGRILRFWKLLDAGALGLPLGQTIGRWGNYFNQELYGLPTNLPWGVYIRPENRLIQVMEFEYFHPLFLYESLWCLIIFLILWKITNEKGKRKKEKLQLKVNNYFKVGSGGVFMAYLGLYGLGRFFLEFLRIESWQINGVNVAQGISLLLTVVALVAIIREKYYGNQ